MVLPENNKLNINALQRIFENANESYVFFWFKALLRIVKEGEKTCSFNRVASIMVTEAWPLILQKNLSLGNTDALEKLILRTASITKLNGNSKGENVYQYVYSSTDVYLKSYKKTVTRVVPYRLQQPFLKGFTAQDWNMKKGKLINKINSREGLIYYIGNPDNLKTKIIIADEWREYLSVNYELLQKWVDLEFLKYIQRYNPEDINWFLNEKYTLEKKISDKTVKYDIPKDNRNYKLDIKMNQWTLDTIAQKSYFIFELHNNTSEDQKFYLDSCSIMHQNIENSMLSSETLNVFDINACDQSFVKICFESLDFDKFANKDILKINLTELNGEKYMLAYRYNEVTNIWNLYEYIIPELDYYDNIQIKNLNSEIFNSGGVSVLLKKINAVMSYKKGYQVQFRVINKTGKPYKLYIANRVDESAKIRNSGNLELLIDGNRKERTKFIYVPYKLVSDSQKGLTTGEPIRQTRFSIIVKVGNELIKGDKEIFFDWLTSQVNIQSLEKSETKTVKITGKDFIIRKNKFYCEKKHNIKTVRAIVSIIRKDGYITEKERPAAYCEKCKQYFILEKDYKRIKNDGTILCKIFETQQDAYKFFDERSYTFDWKSESSLKAMGYNVNAKSALTEAQRQGILAYAVDSGVYTVFQLCDFLGWLINSNYNKETMHNAVAKWQSDRDFISNYRAGEYEKYFANSITAKRY